MNILFERFRDQTLEALTTSTPPLTLGVPGMVGGAIGGFCPQGNEVIKGLLGGDITIGVSLVVGGMK